MEIVEFIEKGRSDAPEFLKKIGDELVPKLLKLSFELTLPARRNKLDRLSLLGGSLKTLF